MPLERAAGIDRAVSAVKRTRRSACSRCRASASRRRSISITKSRAIAVLPAPTTYKIKKPPRLLAFVYILKPDCKTVAHEGEGVPELSPSLKQHLVIGSTCQRVIEGRV